MTATVLMLATAFGLIWCATAAREVRDLSQG